MAGPLIYDRVVETTTTTGTGTLTLAGAVTGFRSFSVVGNANTCRYTIEGIDGSGVPTGEWEVGIGTYTSSGTTLSRDLILASSNSGSVVNLSAGTKRVFITADASILTPLQPCDGRLTTESGVPVSTSDRTSQSTIYFTPVNGNRIALWNGSGWFVRTFSEVSLALSGLTSGKNYDVFAYDNSGTLTLELSAAWTNDTTRADALALQDGVYVKSGTATRRHVGTIYTTSTTTTEDSRTKRFVWNRYNQVPRHLYVQETANSWTYTTAAWRSMNNSTTNRVEFTTGDVNTIDASVKGQANQDASSANVATGIGVDSTSSNSAQWFGQTVTTFAPAVIGHMVANVAAGYHYLQALEYGGGSGTTTWYGDAGISALMTGMTAIIEA